MDFAIFGNLSAIQLLLGAYFAYNIFGSKYDNRIGNKEIEDLLQKNLSTGSPVDKFFFVSLKMGQFCHLHKFLPILQT